MQKKIDLINGPILSSLTKLALPIMATSLIQMAYNMIDMIWIGRLGSSAVASVGAAGMYMWLSNGLEVRFTLVMQLVPDAQTLRGVTPPLHFR